MKNTKCYNEENFFDEKEIALKTGCKISFIRIDIKCTILNFHRIKALEE